MEMGKNIYDAIFQMPERKMEAINPDISSEFDSEMGQTTQIK
jgi:hypothetical protein